MQRQTSKEQLAALLSHVDSLAKIARDESHALSARAENAYGAVRAAAIFIVARAGFTINSNYGHHREPFEAACQELGLSQGQYDRLEALMDIRNGNYKGIPIASEEEAESAIAEMENFLASFASWIGGKPENLPRGSRPR